MLSRGDCAPLRARTYGAVLAEAKARDARHFCRRGVASSIDKTLGEVRREGASSGSLYGVI